MAGCRIVTLRPLLLPENTAVRVLDEEKKYNLDKVIKAGYDTRLAAFEVLVPALINVYQTKVLASDTVYANLKEAIDILKNWDYRCAENSVATTLAVCWGEKISPSINWLRGIDDQVVKTKNFAANATVANMIEPLLATIKQLQTNFGNWQIEWGAINRFQRISNDIEYRFDDEQPSLPVAFASSAWGMLPSYASNTYPGTKKRYGYHGNSFVCAVEFGKTVKAKSLLAGGESGNAVSANFKDQALMYTKGIFKEVLFYKNDVLKKAVKNYHPGKN
jgi:acyl-homoserine-lactone acylase